MQIYHIRVCTRGAGFEIGIITLECTSRGRTNNRYKLAIYLCKNKCIETVRTKNMRFANVSTSVKCSIYRNND
jgi:hypothetical protein